MADFTAEFIQTLVTTVFDVAPILIILVGFQVFVLRRKVPNLKNVVAGMIYVVLGLAFFLLGLEDALFPLGKDMARELTTKAYVDAATVLTTGAIGWENYLWVYVFAFLIGFSTTIAEPALIAVTLKAQEVTGGALKAFGLRIAVAIGVAVGITLGTFRIITGEPLHYFIMAGYAVVILQTWFAQRAIIPLAYDSGGVTTSTVTVPLVTALGLGLASTIPGRSPLIDGFGLIAFASLFPIMSVMGYAQLSAWREKWKRPSTPS